MRVESIKSSIYLSQINCNKCIKFGVSRPLKPLKSDTFEVVQLSENQQFEKFVESIYSKIQRQLHSFTPRKLENAIQNTLKAFPQVSEEEVLTVMQRLTQWANYTCLPKFSEMLSENNIGSINYSTPINRNFHYFQHKKRLFPENKHLKEGQIVTMSELMYFRNRPNLNNIKFINLEGFNDGITLFDDDNLLEAATQKFLKKLQIIKEKSPQKSFQENLFQALNGNIITLTKFLGYPEPVTFSIKAPPTREAILKQMAPFSPESLKDIKITIETIARHFTNNDNEYKILRNNIADYYESKLDVYTKQRLIESLKVMHNHISSYLTKKQIPPQQAYLFVPIDNKLTKSYNIITYMFAKMYNIPPENILQTDKLLTLNNYRSESAFIILDDITASGSSLANAAHYDKSAYYLNSNNHILFCPLSANTESIETVKDVIFNAKRKSIDDILTVQSNLKNFKKSARQLKIDKYFFEDQTGIIARGYEGFSSDYGPELNCIVFPYMAPDNNVDLASFIVRFFLPSKEAISSIHSGFDEIYCKLLKNIKKSKKD